MKKIALVTGGSRGIGKAICIELAKHLDLHILINYNSNEAAAKDTLAQIEAFGGSAEILKCDVATAEDVEKTLNIWQTNNPEQGISILINNAGITKDGLFMWMPEADWSSVFNTSVNGFFNMTQKVIQPMMLQKFGRIINIVSLSGLHGQAGQTNYSAAKGAIISATKALSKEVAKKGVTVNAVAPGFITSDMTKDLDQTQLKKQIPANRFGEPEEVAHLVAFLASEKASYITGEIISISGGI